MRIFSGSVAQAIDTVVILLAALLTVTLLWSSASNTSSDALPAMLMLTASLSSYGIGRRLGRRWQQPALLTVVAAVCAIAVTSPGILSGNAVAPPLDYGNANGALLAIGVVAALALAVSGRGVAGQVGWIVAPLLVIATAMTDSKAAAALALAAAVSTAAVVISRGSATALVSGCAVGAVVLVVVCTTLLGFMYDGAGSAPWWAVDSLSERRVALWHDAVVLMVHHPFDGVGPGRFPSVSPVAISNPDTQFAHSLPLELGAEAGVIAGVAVLALLVALAMAAAVRQSGAAAVVATWAVAVFAVQAGMDYIYRFPAVVLLASLVAGVTAAASYNGLSRHRRTVEQPHETALNHH